MLEVPALQWLGRISYGAYLYHWPLFLWITADRIGVARRAPLHQSGSP